MYWRYKPRFFGTIGKSLRVDQIWKEKDQDQNRLVLEVLEFGIGNLDC